MNDAAEQVMQSLQRAIQAQRAGDHATALREHLFIHADCGHDDHVANNLRGFALYEWGRLCDTYPPAREALVAVRDEEVRRLLAGEAVLRSFNDGLQASRWREVARINETLGDMASTYHTFVALLDVLPEEAKRGSHIALPALIAHGDFALAGRFLPDPLAMADDINANAAVLPLMPGPRQAPRLAADLMSYAGDVALAGVILAGLGREDEATALRTACLAALADPALSALVQQEVDAPGTISRMVSDHQMAADAEAARQQ